MFAPLMDPLLSRKAWRMENCGTSTCLRFSAEMLTTSCVAAPQKPAMAISRPSPECCQRKSPRDPESYPWPHPYQLKTCPTIALELSDIQQLLNNCPGAKKQPPFNQLWAIWEFCWPMLAEFGLKRFRQTSTNIWSTSTKFGRAWPTSSNYGLNRTSLGRVGPTFGQDQPLVVEVGQRLDQSRQDLAECGPRLGSRCNLSATSGQSFNNLSSALVGIAKWKLCGTRGEHLFDNLRVTALSAIIGRGEGGR